MPKIGKKVQLLLSQNQIKMSKGIILFYDDDSTFSEQFKSLYEDSGFEIICFDNIMKLRNAFKDQNLMFNSKALIFDLAQSKTEEENGKDFEILDDIQEKFNNYRIPIFIHSAFSLHIDHFKNCGTVWKIEKSGNSLEKIIGIIKCLDESGFLDAFTPNGIIEQNLMSELHKSFTEQFREGEIEKIISQIKNSNPKGFKERSINVFKRTAVKSLMSELLTPVFSDGKKMNPIEHYYRRISKVDYWTGDILKRKDNSKHILILTPRCNVASKKYDYLLACEVLIGEFPKVIVNRKERDKIQYALTDNPEFSGYNRYIPPSPLFAGGKIVLSNYLMISKIELSESYEIQISLSDELTNEIIGKFGAYFFRTGITPWEQIEVIESIKEK